MTARPGSFVIVRGADRRRVAREHPGRRDADWAELHRVIDAFMDHERRCGDARGYSSRAAGCEDASSGTRQWTSEHETITEALERNELALIRRAWAKLGMLQEQLLRADWRTRGDTRYHQINDMPIADQIEQTMDAKVVLRRFLMAEGVQT